MLRGAVRAAGAEAGLRRGVVVVPRGSGTFFCLFIKSSRSTIKYLY